MMVRLLPIRVDARVRTRSGNPYELPAGLAADREVRVLSYDPQTYLHVVRDEAGREWTITARQNLDAGSEYRVGHRWLPAGHPEVVFSEGPQHAGPPPIPALRALFKAPRLR